jgi:hypothetical protein
MYIRKAQEGKHIMQQNEGPGGLNQLQPTAVGAAFFD